MSYCRFSSDNWQSDVYVYKAPEGFMVHVSFRRIVGDVPTVPPYSKSGRMAWWDAREIQDDFVRNADTVVIGGIFDGQSFVLANAEDAIETLQEVAAAGYHVPRYVIPALEDAV